MWWRSFLLKCVPFPLEHTKKREILKHSINIPMRRTATNTDYPHLNPFLFKLKFFKMMCYHTRRSFSLTFSRCIGNFFLDKLFKCQVNRILNHPNWTIAVFKQHKILIKLFFLFAWRPELDYMSLFIFTMILPEHKFLPSFSMI